MAYCINCGQELANGTKFCANCGKAVNDDNSTTQRKTVYDGEIHKCPNCGEVIESFVSICPACGFELGGKQVSATLEKFINKVNECESQIANSPTAKTGWTSWNESKRFWWIVLNLIFMCIPLVIYLVLPLILIKFTPKLTKEEKQMVSLIENFPFPNDRESILAALVYAKEKIDFISKEKIDRKSAYWIRLWYAKAKQLKQKADMLFPNDNIVKQCYVEIVANNEIVKKRIKIKAIVGLIILIFAIIFTIVRYDVFDNTGITGNKDYSATFEWQTNGLFAKLPQPSTNNGKIVMETENQVSLELYNVETIDFESYVKLCREIGFTTDITKTDGVFYAKNEEGHDLNIFYHANKNTMDIVIDSYDVESNSSNKVITPTNAITVKNFTVTLPDYWDEEGSKNEYLQYYAEKGDKVVMLSIAYPKESDDTYDVSFKGLKDDNDNMITTVSKMFTDGDVVNHEIFESDYGVKGILYHFTYKQQLDFITQVDGSGYCFCFPSENDRRWFYIVLLHTNNVPSSNYKDDYMNLLASIKEK